MLLGAYDDAGSLLYIGMVGTGFTHQMLIDLGKQVLPLHRTDPPFDAPVPRPDARDATSVEPRLVSRGADRIIRSCYVHVWCDLRKRGLRRKHLNMANAITGH